MLHPEMGAGLRGKAIIMKVMEYIRKYREEEDRCECVILPNGEVEEPLPSHIGKLVELAGRESSELNGHMERNMEPLFWMVEYTGCMSVWQTRVVAPSEPAQAQMDTLEILYDAAFLSPGYLFEKAGREYAESVKMARTVIGSAPERE